MSVLSGLANDIFTTEFDGDASFASEASVLLWLNANLGKLNSKINTSFSGSDSVLDLEAQTIHKLLFLGNYYTKASRNALRGIISSSGGGDILSLKDGNSSVSFVNKNEVSKTYRSLATSYNSQADDLSHQYNMYQSEPLQLGGIDGAGYYSTNPKTVTFRA